MRSENTIDFNCMYGWLQLVPEVLSASPALIVWNEEEEEYEETAECTFKALLKYDVSYIRNKKKFIEDFQAMRYRTAAVGDSEIGIVFVEEEDIMYAGGITNVGVFREYEIEVDYDFSLDEHLCELIVKAEEDYFEEINNNDN